MMSPSGPRPKIAVETRAAIDPARLEGTNINPGTGLATDFLNHFNEAIMLLELLPSAPDCIEDFLSWRPMTYREHFEASHFKHRDLAIAAYENADPLYRQQLDEISAQMNRILLATQDGLKGNLAADTIRILAGATDHWLRPLVARAGALINGEPASLRPVHEAEPQDTVDALFDHEVESVFHC
jgi:hypothetical protein